MSVLTFKCYINRDCDPVCSTVLYDNRSFYVLSFLVKSEYIRIFSSKRNRRRDFLRDRRRWRREGKRTDYTTFYYYTFKSFVVIVMKLESEYQWASSCLLAMHLLNHYMYHIISTFDCISLICRWTNRIIHTPSLYINVIMLSIFSL